MRVFTVLGPSHSGKTTLVEALAALDGKPSRKLEVQGAAGVTTFSFMDEDWTAIDIAGGTENLALAGPALAASDAAVVCVPPEADGAVLAAPYLDLVESAGLPSILFINRIDAATDRAADIVAAMQAYCGHKFILRQVPIRDGDKITGAVDLISERAWEYHEGRPSSLIEIPASMQDREHEARTELLESLADFDDSLLEQLIEDKQPLPEAVYDVATHVLQHHDLVPVFLGSAAHRNGIMRLMKSLRHEAPGWEVARDRLGKGSVIAVGCVGDQVKHLGKTILLRAFAPISTGDKVAGETLGGLTEIDARTSVAALQPGAIGLALKSDHLSLGTSFTAVGSVPLPDWAAARPSSYRRIVTPTNERDVARLASALDRLTEIDPGLASSHDARTGHTILATQGPQHLRRVIQKLDDGFGVSVDQSDIPPALCETVKKKVDHHHRHRKQSGGAGQFADVVIELSPLPRGTGFTFTEEVKGGAVPRNYIPAVEAGARDALEQGPHGHPVIDVAVILKDGKHHAVDSSDFAFRTAGKNAVKEAIGTAGAVLLQPIVKVDIRVPSVFAGNLVPVVSGMKGQVLGFEADTDMAGWDRFSALLPMTAEDELFQSLGGATRGTAWFTAEFDHYQEARKDDLL
jgi:elongation factor G